MSREGRLCATLDEVVRGQTERLDGPPALPERCDALEVEQALADVTAALFHEPPEPVPLGRYVLLDRIGKGGGGVVYRGYDPELDRRVAIKLLRPDAAAGSSPSWTGRLLGEAQAIAKFSHPNIVAVHDVGQLPPTRPQLGPGVFIVMELVEGETLARWLQHEPRSWRQVLEVLAPIGRALVAAHRAELVHRDVKPGNILVASDGRPRLVDFGLARATLRREPGDDGSASLARTSALGTPSTMAPEQHLGQPADARTDQYGFCATLHAALHGVYPFAGDDLPALLHAKQHDAPRTVREVPRWLIEIVARGLAPDPDARFADMDALLGALEHGRGRARRWALGLGSAAAVLALAAAATIGRREPATAACIEEGETRIDGVWGTSGKADALAGLRATGGAHAEETSALVGAHVDAYVERWRAAHASACERAFAIRDEPAQVSAARLGCLDRALDEVQDLGGLLQVADEQVLVGAVDAARRLREPAECEAASDEAATDPDLEGLLRRASLHVRAGKLDSGDAMASDAALRAAAIDDETSHSRALLLRCRIAADRGSDAEPLCENGLLAAERSGNDRQAIRALLQLSAITDAADAERLYKLAEARLQGLPEHERDAGLQAELALTRARLRDEQRRWHEATAAYEEGLQLLEQARGPDHPELARALNGLGMLYSGEDRLQLAADAYARALAITSQAYGDHHPTLGFVLNNLAGVELQRGRHREALVLLERALDIKIAAMGPRSPRLVNTLHRIARAHVGVGGPELALAPAELALQLSHPDPESLANAEVVLALVLRAADRCAEALPLLATAEQRFAAVDSRHTTVAELWRLRGGCAAQLGDPSAARTALHAAIERIESDRGPAGRGLVAPLLELAALEEPARARALLERAQTIARATEGDPAELDRLADALARRP